MRIGWPLLLLLTACSGQPPIAPDGIISNNPCIDAVLAEIATPEGISAVSIYSQQASSASVPMEWAKQFPAIGTSAEEVISARPKLLLTGNLASSGTNAALAKAGVKMRGFGVPATVEESKAQVREIAAAIGRQDSGDRLLERIDAVTEPTTPLGKSAIIWQSGGFVAGKGTLQDELLLRAGYSNASENYGLKQWQQLPLETLIRNPPDVIFMPASGTGDTARELAMRERLLRHFKGKTQIVGFPDKLLFCGGPTIIEAMKVMRSRPEEEVGDKTVALSSSKGACPQKAPYVERRPSTGSGLRLFSRPTIADKVKT